MTAFTFTFSSLLLLLLAMQGEARGEVISNLAIDGWWTDCNNDIGIDCAGSLVHHEPFTIDPTGQTCYINPVVKQPAPQVVHWFRSLPAEDSISANVLDSHFYDLYLYSFTIPRNASEAFPSDCTSGGQCSCETIEPLRIGWNGSLTISWCPSGSDSCGYRLFQPSTTECEASVASTSTDPVTNETRVSCYLLASLVVELAPTAAPTQFGHLGDTDPAPTSGAAVSKWDSILGFAAMSLVFHYM